MATAIVQFDNPYLGEIASTEELVQRHLPLVEQVALRIKTHLPPSTEIDDLVGAGTLGLIDAAERFDPTRGKRFRSFAERRIRGAILDHLRSLDWAPRSLRRKARELESALVDLEREHGRAADDAEVARYLDIDMADLHGLKQQINASRIASYDEEEELPESPSSGLLGGSATLDSASSPFVKCQLNELRSRMADSIEALSDKERLVISLYYVEELTMKEIGSIIGVNESRVSQIHSKAISRLQYALSDFAA